MVIELKDLTLNRLHDLDDACYSIELFMRNYSVNQGRSYNLPNRQDVLDLVNKLMEPIEE